MENRHREALRRIFQADRALASDGGNPEWFRLLALGGMRTEIDHPRWDPSWAVPDEQTIDDLEELGILRVQPTSGKSRTFALTMEGRREAEAITQQLVRPATGAGRAPGARDVLRWLTAVEVAEPACFDLSERLIDRAVAEGFVQFAAREALARRILGLLDEGYLRGNVPDVVQATAEQLLSVTTGLETTIKASELSEQKSRVQQTVFAPIINSQIAGGDIANYVAFIDVLDCAVAEINDLSEVDDVSKEEALTLIDHLRGKAAAASAPVLTGAGGALLATVLGPRAAAVVTLDHLNARAHHLSQLEHRDPGRERVRRERRAAPFGSSTRGPLRVR